MFVGVIENIMIVVVLVEGEIIIENVVIEFEVVCFVNFLNLMGVKVMGVGIDIIRVLGVKKFFGCLFVLILDRIEVGMYMVMVVMCGGVFEFINVICEYIRFIIVKFKESGVKVYEGENVVCVEVLDRILVIDIKILFYFGFLIDM